MHRSRQAVGRTANGEFITKVVLWLCCLLPGSREQAFVFALSSAAVLQAVAKTCSSGAASKCGCGRSPSTSAVATVGGGGGGVEGFKWGGCADNVDFGAEFSRSFCDARWTGDRRRRRSKRAVTNLHNNDAGRTVSTRGLRTFPGKSFSRKIVCHCFNVKQTLTVFCVNWRIILLTGLLSLIREVMQRGRALFIFTLSALM